MGTCNVIMDKGCPRNTNAISLHLRRPANMAEIRAASSNSSQSEAAHSGSTIVNPNFARLSPYECDKKIIKLLLLSLFNV